jgi:GNAT superfamily N-acetyltransferase
MADEIQMLAADPLHSDGIAEVIRYGFDPLIQEAVIYGCAGISRFVRDQIEMPRAVADRTFTVALLSGTVVGCVEMRSTAGGLFLNYISVIPAMRSRRVGATLLAHAIRNARRAGKTQLTLDVLTSNQAARSWYERLGFSCESTSEWWDLSVPEMEQPRDGLVLGFPQAQASHARFGFSQFTVSTDAGTFPIGRIGDRWFRVTRSAALEQPAVFEVIGCLDPARRLLAIVGEGTLPPRLRAHGGLLASTVRMSAELDPLLGRLDAV